MGERSWMAGPPADVRPTCTSCARTARRVGVSRSHGSGRRVGGLAARTRRRIGQIEIARGGRGPPEPARGCAAACARPGCARPRPAPPSPWPVPEAASAACARAVSSARVRASSSAGDTGWKVASRLRLARTGSPGSSSIRSTRPATGAETTKRSRTRVSPSSSSVTCEGARGDRGDLGRHRRGPERPDERGDDGEDDDGGDEPARCEEPSDGEEAPCVGYSRLFRTWTRSR